MRVSDRGLAFLAGHEGIVPYPYRDSTGVWTFGVGHTASAGPPDPAGLQRGEGRPMAEVIEVFRRDLATFEARVGDAVRVALAPHEFDALVSFDFNTGGIYRAKLTAHLNRGDRRAAADAFMGWLKPVEIKRRRVAEQALFRSGRYGDGTASIYPADADGRVLWSQARRVNVAELLAGPASEEREAPAPVDHPPAHPAGGWDRFAAFLRAVITGGCR